MKIARIETFLARSSGAPTVIVKVETDDGLHGVGEAYSAGPNRAVAEVVADFAGWQVGHDPREVERLWQLMYNGSRFPPGVVTGAAISGIEQALWDRVPA